MLWVLLIPSSIPSCPHEAALRVFSIFREFSPPGGLFTDHKHCPKKGWAWTSWINSRDALENSLFLMLVGPQVLCAASRLFWSQ